MSDDPSTMQQDLDRRVLDYYGDAFDENDRLVGRSDQGVIEFERTQELITARVPAGSRVLDVGGATGVHAAPLDARGDTVTLMDPVPSHVAAAAAHGTFEALVGDARSLPQADGSVDAVLLLGPLYHLIDRAGRLRAIREARRVLRPGGYVFAGAIPRTMAHAFTLPGSSLTELSDGGLVEVEVHGLEGPGGMPLEVSCTHDPELRAAAMLLARRFSDEPDLRDLSQHLLGIGRCP